MRINQPTAEFQAEEKGYSERNGEDEKISDYSHRGSTFRREGKREGRDMGRGGKGQEERERKGERKRERARERERLLSCLLCVICYSSNSKLTLRSMFNFFLKDSNILI